MDERRALLRTWASDPWAFLTGRDVDGAPLIVTQDEECDTPFRPFPTDKAYLRVLTQELVYGPEQVCLVDKSRRMLVSTLCMLLLYWTVLFKRGRHCMLSKQNKDLAEMMLQDKVRGVHGRTPGWFQAALPISPTPANRIVAERTGSDIIGVTENAALRHFRGAGASIVLIDEAAFQEYFADMLRAALPMAARIWAVSTAQHGNPGAEKFYELKMEV